MLITCFSVMSLSKIFVCVYLILFYRRYLKDVSCIKRRDQPSIPSELPIYFYKVPDKYFSSYFFSIFLYRQIIYRFLVDDVPIRRYPRKSDATFPMRPMWVYGSIWDASSWATEGGKYKANYHYQPFIGKYKYFRVGGCTADAPGSCVPPSTSPSGSTGLSQQQRNAMEWVQKNYLVYDYCKDPKRDHSQIPECN